MNTEEAKHVLGAQAQLWSEYIPNAEHLEYMAYPRACALSEVLWSPASGRDYKRFLRRLSQHVIRLQAAGVNFRAMDAP